MWWGGRSVWWEWAPRAVEQLGSAGEWSVRAVEPVAVEPVAVERRIRAIDEQ